LAAGWAIAAVAARDCADARNERLGGRVAPRRPEWVQGPRGVTDLDGSFHRRALGRARAGRRRRRIGPITAGRPILAPEVSADGSLSAQATSSPGGAVDHLQIFADRTEAGRALADRLAVRGYSDPVVLALPRGGVPVGLEVARALGAPLDLVLVRKIGVPYQPELALAAVVNGDHPELVINEDVRAVSGVSERQLESATARELAEIERRRALYLEGRDRVDVAGKTAIVVDDGIATGATVRAALKALRRARPATLVLAVPVAPAQTIEFMRGEVDEVVCLETPEPFYAIGPYYRDFSQVSDDEVVALMSEPRGAD
jgi:putative phosphoribosyl transferase